MLQGRATGRLDGAAVHAVPPCKPARRHVQESAYQGAGSWAVRLQGGTRESPMAEQIPNRAEMASFSSRFVVAKGIDHAICFNNARVEPEDAFRSWRWTIGCCRRCGGREGSTRMSSDVSGTIMRSVAKDARVPLCGEKRCWRYREIPPIDLAIEATGVASVAFHGMQVLGRNGVLCLLSVTGGSKTADQPIEKINQQLVLGNQVVFGSVNANPRHFAMGVKDFTVIEKKWPGVLKQLITTRLPWDQYSNWFGQRGSGIKTTLEIS